MDKITPEELREMLGGAPNENYIFEGDDITFIKEQNITVESGANFYNGAQPKPQKEQEAKKSSSLTLTPLERTFKGIRAIKESGLAEKDYDYIVAYKLILEKRVFDKLSFNDFVRLLKDSGAFDDNTCPSGSNVSKYQIKGEYPNWKITDKGYLVTKHLLDLARVFLQASGL